YRIIPLPHLPSFPTRRSSDLSTYLMIYLPFPLLSFRFSGPRFFPVSAPVSGTGNCTAEFRRKSSYKFHQFPISSHWHWLMLKSDPPSPDKSPPEKPLRWPS